MIAGRGYVACHGIQRLVLTIKPIRRASIHQHTFPALQLADILAYETGRFVPFVLGWDTSPVRKGFQAMLDDGNPYVSMLFNFEELSNIARHPETERP